MNREELYALLEKTSDMSKIPLSELLHHIASVESIAFQPSRQDVKTLWEVRERLVVEFAHRGYDVRILNRRLRATYAMATGERVTPVEGRKRRR